jgi:hypothetical protein
MLNDRVARAAVASLAVVPALVLGGCASAPGAAAARQTAEQFLTAVTSGDAATACGLLAPDAVRQVESDGTACAQALPDLGLPGGQVDDVAAWGDGAQAHAGADTLFLRELQDGWRVVAAGCKPRGDAPYECAVEAK